jgi:excisionase family DNA binding protein
MKKDRTPGHRLLTRAQVAALFQVSPSTITRWAEAGKLPVVKTLGGHRRYDAAAVQALAQQIAVVTQPDRSQNKLSSSEEANMTKTTIDVPAMYGDHHVLEVRKILTALPGVEGVTASSCFHTVEVEFNPDQAGADDLRATLAQAGYLTPLPFHRRQIRLSPKFRKKNVPLTSGTQPPLNRQNQSSVLRMWYPRMTPQHMCCGHVPVWGRWVILTRIRMK